MGVSMASDLSRGFVLGAWEVYPQRNLIVAGSVRHHVEGKVMGVLLHLAQNAGEVVNKDALLDAVWPNQAVADGVLTRAIYELRQALGDAANDPRYIRNVPRVGYRLLEQPRPVASGTSSRDRGLARRLPAVLGATALLLGALISYQFFAGDNGAPRIASVAVLPFANLTGSDDNAYLSDGLTEEVIHLMAQQSELMVAARTSSFALRDRALSVTEIGKRLGVDSIVEGSVRKERGVQRVTLQLIDVRSGMHRGSVTLDVVEADLFQARERIAESIFGMLSDAGANIAPLAAPATRSASSQAYDLYLRGRAALHTRSADSLQAAKEYLLEAIRLDYSFAPAHAVLGQLYIVSRIYLQLDAEESARLAGAAVKLALELDPGNVDALTAAAALAADRGRYAQSVATFQRAMDLHPSNALAHLWFGQVLHLLGYTAEGTEHVATALRLDPLAGSTNTVMAYSASLSEDDGRLLQAARQAEALGARLAPKFLSLYEFRRGNIDGFAREITRHHAVIGIDEAATALLVDAAHGRIGEADLVAQLEPYAGKQNIFFAREFAMLGMHSAAIAALLRAPNSGGSFLSDMWMPEFRPVREKPEFAVLVNLLGYDEYWNLRGPPDACDHGTPEAFCGRLSLAAVDRNP